MKYFIRSISNIGPWMQVFAIGLIISISYCYIWIMLNPSAKIFYLSSIRNDTFGGIVSILVIVTLITALCLLVPSSTCSRVVGKMLILLIGIYLGAILVLFIKSTNDNYSIIVCPGVQAFSILWCLSIGSLKANIAEKAKLAIMPFSLLAAVSIYQVIL